MPPTLDPKQQQRRTLWPMPSGSGRYFETLRLILDAASREAPLEELTAKLVERYAIATDKTARSYIDVASTLGFVTVEYQRVALTHSGRGALEEGFGEHVASALVNRVVGCAEIVEELRTGPRLLRKVRLGLEERGINWKTSSQIRYRLRWMEECGLIERGGSGPAVWYALIDDGKSPVL